MSALAGSFESIAATTSAVGEGPLWRPESNELLWVDVHPGILHRLDLSTGAVTSRFVAPRLSFIVAAGEHFIGGYRDGLLLQDLAGKQPARLFAVDADRAFLRPNDGACDPAGRLWFGTVDRQGQKGRAHLYCLDGDGVLRQAVDGISMSNGLSWSPSGHQLYYIDSVTGGVDAFDYDVASGEVGARRQLTRTSSTALPDGMAVDCEGNIWVAMYRGGCLLRISPGGEVLEQVEVPTGFPTSCAFGGSDLDQLFVTTSNVEATRSGAVTPADGRLLVVATAVRGIEPTPHAVPLHIFGEERTFHESVDA